MSTPDEFPQVFARLREILLPYSSKLIVAMNTDREYYLNSPVLMKNKKQILFAGVSIGKSYVSFHLMPVYAAPELVDAMSPELKRRMQGKSCFNFREIDERLFRELAKLTRTGFARFKTLEYL